MNRHQLTVLTSFNYKYLYMRNFFILEYTSLLLTNQRFYTFMGVQLGGLGSRHPLNKFIVRFLTRRHLSHSRNKKICDLRIESKSIHWPSPFPCDPYDFIKTYAYMILPIVSDYITTPCYFMETRLIVYCVMK